MIVPVFNEIATMGQIVQRVRDGPVDAKLELVIVDDGLTDGTRLSQALALSSDDVRVVFQPSNRGKGAAIRHGVELVTGEVAIIQDADFECDRSTIRP